MIIDFHTHIFPEQLAAKTLHSLSERSGIKPSTDGTLPGLLASMKKASVNCSVILPVVTNPVKTVSINDSALLINESQNVSEDHFVISFGGIHPDTPDYKKELNRLMEHGIKGIKLHPSYQGTNIDDIRYLRIITCAASLGMMISIHAGIDIGLPVPICSSPDQLLHMYHETKADKLIFAHTGGWNMWDDVEQKLAGLPVYFDTAFTFGFIRESQMKRIIQKHGTDKILFATDSPWSDPVKDILALKHLSLKNSEQTDILSGNARRLLGC